MRSLATCALALILASPSYAADVDWKLFGSHSSHQSYCFYEANGISHTPSGTIRVWTKCLPRKDLDVELKGDDGNKVLKSAARKVVSGYVPPIVAVEDVKPDEINSIVLYEESADIRGIEPDTQIFLELNCSQKMDRQLSAFVRQGDKSGFINRPGDWEYAPPEGNPARLLKILCPAQ